MAGDWIPIRTELPDHPKTLRIAQQLRKSTDEIVGLLVRFWSWVQQHTDSGRLEGISIELAALGAKVPPKFLEALVDVDWLVVADPDLLIPEFPRWFSGAAKRRLRDAARKRAVRNVSASCPQNVRKMSTKCPQNVRNDADKMRTIGQDRIEENRDNLTPSILPEEENSCASPGNIDSSESKIDSEPPFLIFPCAGPQKQWHLTKSQMDRFRELFPALDIEAEMRKALAWVESSPRNRKTASGMLRFLTGWLSRAQDRPSSGANRHDTARVRRDRPPPIQEIVIDADA